MAIRPSFTAFAACFLWILHPSAAWPEDTGPHLSSSDSLEFSVVTPVDDIGRPGPSVEAKGDILDAADDPSIWVPLDFDPWAYAFAESSRLQTVGSPMDVPTYDVVMNHQVKFFVDRFTTSRRDVVGLWLQRSPQYLGMIWPVFRSKGLPDELAYTAMIESGFNPLAVSRAGAKGLWQFMAGTARLYGLRGHPWGEQRPHPGKSPHAAAPELRGLGPPFGPRPPSPPRPQC